MKQLVEKAVAWLLVLSSVTLLPAGMMAGCADRDALYRGFADPPMSTRPFVRWWWSGNAVEAPEIQRQLDVLKEAGIGGVEINPVAMPAGARDIGAESLTWLNPSWNRMLKYAVEGCRKRGMTADLIVGSGWPFGGRFLDPDERTQLLTCHTVALEGPSTYRTTRQALTSLWRKPFRPFEGATKPQLQFLRLVPNDAEHIEQSIDLLDRILAADDENEAIAVPIPSGHYTLYVGLLQKGFSKVVHGAPGADGPVLDHFNRRALEKYLNRMSDALDPVLGGRMGHGLRAMFCDSIELSGANWTGDMPEQFHRRRGYELEPWLPFVLMPKAPEGDAPLHRAIRRARYDFSKTLVELFHERFIGTFHQWCHRHGVLSRYQAYGSRMIGMLDAYRLPDIPEGDTWLFHPKSSVGPTLEDIRYAVWNKYASSGAHLAGRSQVSCESMTNLDGVFSATLGYIKQADDLNFITGVNQTVLHGYTYSPPQAGFPGWVLYGTYFNEKNTWWPYMRCWTDYNARLSYVFQNSHAVNRVAILGPNADIWSDRRLSRPAFLDTPWYRHHLWQAMAQNGCGADYVSETVIQQSQTREGRLCFGPAAYDLLLVVDAQTIEPKTATALRDYVRAGGRIAFVGQAPQQSPGLLNAKANDATVRDAMREVLSMDSRQVAVVIAPDKGKVRTWAGDLLTRLEIRRDVTLQPTDDRLFQTRHRSGDRDIFFLCNLWRDRDLDVHATFDTNGKTPWRWDPQNGHRAVYPQEGKPNQLTIHLEPQESLLLVFEPDRSGPAQPLLKADRRHGVPIDGPWRLTCKPVAGEPFELTLAALVDFKDHPRLKHFAGEVIYKTTFDVEDAAATILSLGAVEGVTEAALNGQSLGVRWWGRPQYDLSNALHSGQNQLVIKLTTVLGNYARTLDDEPTAVRWTRGFRARPLASVGMLGPVQRFRPTPP